MKLCRKVFRTALLALIMLVLISGPVFAAYSYYVTIQVQETGGIDSYAYLPIIVDIDNDYLADNGYISLTGLDTKILSGSTPLEHLIADDKVLFVAPSIGANSTSNYRYTLGNSLLSDFPVIVGNRGYITISDDDTLDGGVGGMDDFELEWKGYVDTAAGIGKNLIHKPAAFSTNVSAANSITAGLVSSEVRVDVTPAASGNWTEVDVSAYVPEGASGVILECESAAALMVGVRKNGSADDAYRDDLQGHQNIMVGIDEDDIFEVYVENHNNSTIYLIGYTDSSWVFKTNWVDVDANALAAWTQEDITPETSADADVAVFYIEGAAGGDREWGLRKDDSTDVIKYDCTASLWNFGVVGLDSEQQFDYYNEDVDLDFILIGYSESGCTFPDDKVNKEPTGAGVWEDVDCSTEAPGSNVVFLELGSNAARNYSVMSPWDIDSSYEEYYIHAFVVGFCDSAQIVQAKVADIAASDFYYVGHSTSGMYRIPHEITYLKSVTVTGITSGERKITASADGVDLILSVTDYDDVHLGNSPRDIGLVAATVPDNGNDWYINQNNVMPYMEYYRHIVADTLIAWYQPISMIIGITLDDREGTDLGETGAAEEDGIITWGANPADLSVTVGSLVSSSQPAVSPASEEEAIDIVPEGEVPITGGVVDTSRLEDNPLYPIVQVVNEYTNYTEEQIWFIGATLIILIGMGIAVVRVPNHLLLAGTVGLILGGFFTAMEIYQWWMMLIFGFMFLMSILMERKPVL